MKKSLTIIGFISLTLAILSHIVLLACAKLIYRKINDNNEMSNLSYFIMVFNVIVFFVLELITLIFLSINTIKKAFVASILFIVIGIMLIFSIFVFTWIFGSINIIIGLVMISVGAIHIKISREYL